MVIVSPSRDCYTVSERFDGDKRQIVGSVIKKLHQPPCPNLKIMSESETEIINTYWKEYWDFDEKAGIYAN